jgi:acetyltransferase-like isoleucine patch superfamily enzyme
MNFRRLTQVIQYGWKDATLLSKDQEVGKGKLGIFCDILFCFLKYNVWSNQYKKEKLYALTGEEKKAICLKYQEKNTKRDKWVKAFFDNYKFLHKWSSFKYELSPRLQAKRRDAYKKQYELKENCFLGYGVIFHKHHYSEEKIIVGKKCHIAEQVNIDYTGGLTLGNGVVLAEGVKILTHGHTYIGNRKEFLDPVSRAYITPLTIEDNVLIGIHTVIMPGVGTIGENSMISAGSVVTRPVPPNSMVSGNPAKVTATIPPSMRTLFTYKKS